MKGRINLICDKKNNLGKKMNDKQKLMITGEKGDVGSVIYKLYKENGFEIYRYNGKKPNTRIDTIIHLAAKSPPASAEEILKSNVDYLKEIVDYSERNNIKEFIFFSTMSVFGTQYKEGLNEDDYLNGPTITLYGASKLFGEKYLQDSSLNVLSIRFPAILGFRNTTNLFSRFYMKLIENEPVEVTNYNKIFNNFISIENIFDFLKDVNIFKKFDVINLASEKELALGEIVQLMKEELNSKSEIIFSDEERNFFNISTEKAIFEYNFKAHDARESIKRWICRRQEYENITISQAQTRFESLQ